MRKEKKSIQPDPRDIEENRLLAAISYLGIVCLVPLFLKRNSDFAQYHAKQGLILFCVMSVSWPLMGLPIINLFVGLFILYLVVYGVYNAWSGRYWQMPLLGKYVNKLNL